ncbi:MAG: VWA domain-containing protein, partial [Planctomycetota bacterium]
MLPMRLGFDHPGYLWLMAAVPLLLWISWNALRVLGPVRRWFAIIFRSIVWSVIVFAIAGVQLVRVNDRVTVMYVLDQSESIPALQRRLMLDYVAKNVLRHRDETRQDLAGILVFGRDASIELPPYDDDIQIRRLESLLERTDATDLESALNLAQASLPEDTACRIVVVTDGNENIGQATKLAARLANAGVGIDTVPVLLESGNEVLVEKIDLPTDIRTGQPFEARIVISNFGGQELGDTGAAVEGTLRVKQTVAGEESLLLEQTITLNDGKNVFPLQHQIERPAPYTYEAEFLPANDSVDSIRENNQATGYTYVRGKGRVLLIQDSNRLGDFALFADSLRDAEIEVVVQESRNMFGSLAELQA